MMGVGGASVSQDTPRLVGMAGVGSYLALVESCLASGHLKLVRVSDPAVTLPQLW